METFKIEVQGKEFFITPALHKGYYEVKCGNSSGLLTKAENGEWNLSLQTPEALDVSAEKLGSTIETHEKELG